jgi:hypothetical protein
MPILWHPLVATSFPNLFLQGNTVTAAANRLLETPPTDIHHHQNTARKTSGKCTDGAKVTLTTTVQQIVTGLHRADIVENRFTLIMLAFMDWLYRYKGHNPPYTTAQRSTVSTPIHVWPLSPSGRRQQYDSPAAVSPMDDVVMSHRGLAALTTVSVIHFTLKMGAAWLSETLVSLPHHNREDLDMSPHLSPLRADVTQNRAHILPTPASQTQDLFSQSAERVAVTSARQERSKMEVPAGSTERPACL